MTHEDRSIFEEIQRDAGARLADLKPGALVEIAPGVIRIVLAVPFPPGGVGVLALEDQIDRRDVWTIVDTGLSLSKPDWIKLLQGPLAGRPVARVVATHFHPDHIGLAGWFQREMGAELWTTRTSWLLARMLQLDSGEESIEDRMRFAARTGFDAEQMERARKRASIGFPQSVAPLPLGYKRIVENDEIRIGRRHWRVLIGHGHAPEHALLHCAEDNIVIAGDQILPKISPNIGVYPAEPEGDPLGDWLVSCSDLATKINDDALILPGHGAPFYGGKTRLGAIVREHKESLDHLEAHLREPRRVIDCFEALYTRTIGPSSEGLAAVETLSHLNHLTTVGRAERSVDEAGVHWWRSANRAS